MVIIMTFSSRCKNGGNSNLNSLEQEIQILHELHYISFYFAGKSAYLLDVVDTSDVNYTRKSDLLEDNQELAKLEKTPRTSGNWLRQENFCTVGKFSRFRFIDDWISMSSTMKRISDWNLAHSAGIVTVKL